MYPACLLRGCLNMAIYRDYISLYNVGWLMWHPGRNILISAKHFVRFFHFERTF